MSNANKPIKVAVYCRVGTKEQIAEKSLEEQFGDVQKWTEEQTALDAELNRIKEKHGHQFEQVN